MALPDSALADNNEVVPAADELPGRQLLYPRPLDRPGVELPVERRQRLALPEARLPDAVGDGPLAARRRLLRDQQVQELQVRQPLVLRPGHGRVERLGP